MKRKAWLGLLLAMTLTLGTMTWSAAQVGQVAPDLTGADFARLRLQLRQEPDNVLLWLRLGEAYLDAGAGDDARAAFLDALSLDYLLAEAHFGLGLAEYARGDFQAALFAFDELVRLYPERFDAHFNRAVALARLRRHSEAAEAFRTAITVADVDAATEEVFSAYVGLAGQYMLLQSYEAAIDAYAAALELEPDPDLSYFWADALYRSGRGLEALPTLSALETATGDGQVSALIADIYLAEGRTDYALRTLERGLERATNTGDMATVADMQFRLGLLYRELGRAFEAERALRGAVAADPTSWQAYYNLGLTLLDSGQVTNALAAFEAAASLNPDSGEIYLALAATQDQLGRQVDARGNAALALVRLSEPELRAEALFIEARALYLEGEYAAAQEAMESVVSLRPESAQAQLWAGLVHYALGNYALAVSYYEQAVQLDPASRIARSNLGAAYLVTSRFSDAQLVYELLIAEDPENAEAYYNLGWAFLSQGRREEARSAWEQAVALGYQQARTDLRQHF